MDVLQSALLLSVRTILPHKTEEEANELVLFLIKEGVKKESDLRRLTIDNLKNVCDTVDASDLHDEWQAQFGVKKNLPTTSRSAAVAEPLRQRNTIEVVTPAPYTIPVIDVESQCMPANVRQAILNKDRPKPKARRVMVERIVDFILDKIPHFKRADFNKVGDQLVDCYPESFKDTICLSEKGSDSLRGQLLIRYDNANRSEDKEAPTPQVNPLIPAAYGCLQWNPPLPEGDTENDQVIVRGNLKRMFENVIRPADWRKVKTDMDSSFYLLRKNINGSVADKPARKRQRIAEPDDELVRAGMLIEELKVEWPCLFKPTGMNHHFEMLTGIDFNAKVNVFMADKGPILIDFLASKGQDRGRERTTMTLYERRGNADASLIALVKLLMMHFKEDSSALVTHVEETTEINEVDTAGLPEDSTPHLVVAGPHLYQITNIFLAIDRKIVNMSETFRDGFCMLFCAYFTLNIQYPVSMAGTLTFVQKVIAGIRPEKGTKCQSSAEQTKVNKKVTKLSNDFIPYYNSISNENETP